MAAIVRPFGGRDQETIANLYAANGFRDAKVNSEVTRDENGKQGIIAVTVHIDEGSQWVVDDLAIHGATELKPAELPSLASSAGQPFSGSEYRQRPRNRCSPSTYTRGFPKATFNASWQIIKPGHVNVSYTVVEGDRPVCSRYFDLSGLRTHSRRSLVDRAITIRPGDPLSPLRANQYPESALRSRSLRERGHCRSGTRTEIPATSTCCTTSTKPTASTFSIGSGAQVAQFGNSSGSRLFLAGRHNRLQSGGISHPQPPEFPGPGTPTEPAGRVLLPCEARVVHLSRSPGSSTWKGRILTYTLLYDKHALNVRTFAAKREEASVHALEENSTSR